MGSFALWGGIMSEQCDQIITIISSCPREGNSDETILHAVNRALGFRRLYYKLGTPEELYKLLLSYVSPEYEQHLKESEYSDFLKSTAWEITRDYKVYLAGYQCEECGSVEKLEVHHKTYMYKGRDYYHLDTLQVLCRKCHQRKHDKVN